MDTKNQFCNVFLSACLCIGFASPVMAINKCKGGDGKVTYQEAACEPSSKGEKLGNIPEARSGQGGAWEFVRQRDDMTGDTTCFAVSQFQYISWGRGLSNSTAIRMQLAVPVGGSALVLSIRSTQGGSSFHSNFEGSGVRVGEGEFVGFASRSGSHGLIFAQDRQPELLGALSKARDFRVRVKMWPYDTLIDTSPISLQGFQSAVQRAMACAVER